MKNISYTVPEMSCEHCVNTIKKALLCLNGINNVVIDLKEKKVAITFDPKLVSDADIRVELDKLGYAILD
jgi:copper chaperone CopZ